MELTELTPTEQRRQPTSTDAAYREWSRDRGDVERLSRLHDAVQAAQVLSILPFERRHGL